MAESTLSLQFTDFQAEVGEYLGEQRSGWDTPTTNRINAVINQAYPEALYPQPLNGKEKGHQWSFLEPIVTLTTTAAEYAYDLPDNYGAILGPLTWDDANVGGGVIPIVSEGKIRQMRQGSDVTGRPTHAATRTKTFDPTVGQRSEIIFFPTPDGEYDLSYRSSLIVALKLDATNKFPIGGMSFGRVVLAACLAVAERKYRRGENTMQAAFMTSLAAEISRDLQNAPEYFGYNGDRSSSYLRGCRSHAGERLTVNGLPTTP